MLKVLCAAAIVSAASSISIAAGLPSRGINGYIYRGPHGRRLYGTLLRQRRGGHERARGGFRVEVNNGNWQGVSLEGLSVVGVIRPSTPWAMSPTPSTRPSRS